MKNPTDQGFEQDYNVQIAVDQDSLLIVGSALSNHPNDSHEAAPTLDSIPAAIGTPAAAALDHGYGGPATLEACADRDIEPYIATGREPHHQSWRERFAPEPDPPPEDASPQVRMAYKLKTAVGKAIYGARKECVAYCTSMARFTDKLVGGRPSHPLDAGCCLAGLPRWRVSGRR